MMELEESSVGIFVFLLLLNSGLSNFSLPPGLHLRGGLSEDETHLKMSIKDVRFGMPP